MSSRSHLVVERITKSPAQVTDRIQADLAASAQSRSASLLYRAPALILLVTAVADRVRIADPDLWGHVLFGRQMLEGHQLAFNPYSYSAPNFTWLHHEWLSEVIMAWLFNQFGPFGLNLLSFACALATVAGLAWAQTTTNASLTIQAAILMIAGAMLQPWLMIRPQLFDFALLAAVVALLARDNRAPGKAPLWIVVPILGVWSNLHGGFFIGLVALGVYAIVVIIQELVAGSRITHGMLLAGIGILAGLATLSTFATRYGPDTWYTLWYTVRNPETRHIIMDWEPLLSSAARLEYYSLLVLVLFAFGAIVFLLTPVGRDLPLVAVAAAMTALAFVSCRNVPFALIALAPPLASHLQLLIASRDAAGASRPDAGTSPILRWPIQLAATAAAVWVIQRGGLLSGSIPVVAYPAGPIAFIEQHRLHGNVLCSFEWGLDVIWHLAPNSKVFIDSRYDEAYPRKVVTDYLKFISGRPGASEVLGSYPHQFVLVPTAEPACQFMLKQPAWALIYRDPDASLFARSDSDVLQLAGIPIITEAPTATFP